MRYPSLNQLYFESLNLPSAPVLWIGCSVALHAGLFLLPLGSSQSIAFAPGDAGVQVELIAEFPPADAGEASPVVPSESDPPQVATEIPPPEKDVALPEPMPKYAPRVAISKKEIARARPENSSSRGDQPTNGATRAGSATAQPAAQIVTTQPPYPPAARENGMEGAVRLRVRVGTDGAPRAVEIARSSGRADFDSSSLSTVKREWRFRPARTVGGAPVESTITVAIHFTLKS